MKMFPIRVRFWSGTMMLHMDNYQRVNAILECLKQQILFDEHHVRDVRSYDHVGEHGAAFMLSTGLVDANGREIYQGDVVRLIHGEATRYYRVVFDSGCFCAQGPPDSLPFELRHLAASFYSIEVIGNIYENHELMEESNELE